ncbi:MAG: hypothetical protein ACK4NT_07935, partial [Candidatus Omnitrophota bacterium]
LDIKKDIDSLSLFERFVKFDLKKLIEAKIVSQLEFEENENLTYTLKFKFLDKARKVKFYFGKDAHYFFPPELEKGYDVLYTRWTFKGAEDKWLNPLKDKEANEIRRKWLNFMQRDTGFIVLDTKKGEGRPFFDEKDNPFWDNFFEIDFKNITTTVIANYRIAHLLVIKNQP